MAYREALMADAQKLEETVFSSSIRFLETEYQKNELRANVLQTFTELFCQWGEQTDKEAASLGICYLHSSILMRTGEIRLTLFGEEFYLDKNQFEKAWYPPCFFQQYEQDMSEIMTALQKHHPRIYPYEENAVRYQYAQYFYTAIQSLCQDMLEELTESEAYQKMKKTKDFFFFFGRWMGEAEKL